MTILDQCLPINKNKFMPILHRKSGQLLTFANFLLNKINRLRFQTVYTRIQNVVPRSINRYFYTPHPVDDDCIVSCVVLFMFVNADLHW